MPHITYTIYLQGELWEGHKGQRQMEDLTNEGEE